MNRAILVTLVMLGPLLALGGVSEEGLIVAVVGVSVLSAATSRSRRPGSANIEVRVASLSLWGLAAFGGIQLIPLPSGLLRMLSPHAWSTWVESDSALGRSLGFHPLTLDLHATTFATVTAAAVAVFFDACSAFARRSAARVRLVFAVMTAVAIVDLVAVAHPLFGFSKVYGRFSLIGDPHRILVSPLLNTNHAAALACIAPPLLIGLALESETDLRKFLAVSGAIVAGAVALLSLSRGGMAVLGLELVAMAAYAVLRGGRARRRIGSAAFAIFAAAGAVTAALYIASEPLTTEARDTNITKLRLIFQAARMTPDFAFFGVGRGAFTSTFPAYEGSLGGLVRFTHVENWPVQLVIDVGFPIAVAIVGTMTWCIARAAPAASSRPLTFSALVALIGLGAHDLADFATAFAGVGMLAAALLAVVLASKPPTFTEAPSSTRRTVLASPAALVAAALAHPITKVLALVAVAMLLPRYWHHDVDEDAGRLADAYLAGRLEEAKSSIAESVAIHPAEPYFAMMEGIRLNNTPAAAPHLLRAIKLGPGRPAPHFWLARWFVLVGRRGQAWAEYREAGRLSPLFTRSVVEDMIVAGAPTADIIAVGGDASALEIASPLLFAHGRSEDAAEIDEVLITRFPPAIDAWSRKVDRAILANKLADARRWSDDLLASAPTDARSYLIGARVAADGEAAENVLLLGLKRIGDDAGLLEDFVRRRGTRVGLASLAGEIERLRAALFARYGRADKAAALQGEIEVKRGRPAAAISHYIDAAAACTGCEHYLEIAAQVAEKNGQRVMAESIYRRLVEAHADVAAYRLALERVREAANTPAAEPSAKP